MLPTSTLKVLLVLPPLITASAFLAIGALVGIRKKPLVFRATAAAWLVTLAAAPTLLAVVSLFTEAPAAICSPAFLFLVLLAVILFAVWRPSAGFIVVAVSERGFRAGLQAALEGLGLPYQESLLGFTLASLHDTLQARAYPALLSAYFRVRSPENSQIGSQIAERFRDHIRHHGEGKTYSAALLYGGAGLVFLLLALYQVARFWT
ncbi:MAG TPA: hypothetical protein VLD63_05910 [Anaerolineales bacterium]|nr:hypothetical protein [Anaerolineales bacterium]